MTRRRANDDYRDLPLAPKIVGLRLPSTVDSYVRSRGIGWVRNIITQAALADMQGSDDDTKAA